MRCGSNFVSQIKKWERRKVTDRQKIICKQCQKITNIHYNNSSNRFIRFLYEHLWAGRKVCDTSSMHLHQSLQFAVLALQELPQQLHTWILQFVLTEVQFCESGRVGLQSWGQRITASLWQPAALQSEERINDGGQKYSRIYFSAF